MTERRYLPDSDDVTAFSATVTETTGDAIVLDGTYFYPEGGGQPADCGTLSWDGGAATVVDVQVDHGDIYHEIEALEGSMPHPGDPVEGQIDATRRDRVRRMHTAQHVISRVVLDQFGAETAGNQIHPDRSRMDFEPASFDAEDLQIIETQSNAIVHRDLPVSKANHPREEVEDRVVQGRALLDLIPDHVDPLRVVEIEGYDYCPCGGTHVDRTGEIGSIEITERSSKGADVDRIEFVLEE